MRIYSKICANLFFLFFTCVIFSPFINGKTFYLFWLIPLIDIKFLRWILKKRIEKNIFIYFILFFIILILYKKIEFIVRICMLIYTLFYLFYLKKVKLFYIFYNYMFFNIIIATLQFFLNYINPNVAYLIGPTNISKLVLGEYAGPTFTNFYSIGLLKRASGFSREVGFFASLMVITIILYIEDKDINKTILKNILLFLGFIISMSKMSPILFIYFIIKKLKKIINKIPLLITISFSVVILCFLSKYLYEINFFISKNETWNHRLGGYYIISVLNLKELILSFKNIEEILNSYENILFLKQLSRFNHFTSISEIILHYGIIIFLFGSILVYKLKMSSSDFLLLTLLTFNTGYITVTSFVILVYFYIFNKERIKKCKNYYLYHQQI